MIELQGVSVTFAEHVALHPTDLHIPAGKTTVLLGPSGCGKSTLLRILLALNDPNTGRVLFEGKPVTAENVQEVRRRMGYVVQEAGLFPHLTALGNIGFLARYLGWEAERIKQRVLELCELTHFEPDKLENYPVQLSGGQRQRVGLMRALMMDPAVLLMDEPMGALDPLVRHEMQNELRDIFRNLGKTVVLVTHDLGEASHFADQMVLLRAGRIVQKGTLSDFWRHPAEPFVSEFIQAQRGPSLNDGEDA
jgi:osmoprotectant transport system ATP-binding protein